MELSCTKNEMIDILNIVQRAVTSKSTHPIMECIKIDCYANDKVIFTGNNTELCIEYKEKLDIQSGGSVAIASKMFGDIVRKLPDGDIKISVDEANNVTTIKGGISEFNIQGLMAEEYPSPPEITELDSFEISESKLRDILRKLIVFVAVTEGKRPTLTGALFEIKGDTLTVVASDGHRLGVVREKLSKEMKDTRFIIPGSTLREMLKFLKDEENSIRIVIAERHIMMEFEKFKVFTRVLEGDFLKYEPIIAANNTIKIIVNTHDFRNSLERAMLIINDDDASPEKRMPVRLGVGFDKIEISCMTPKGKVNDIINAQIEGGELIIGFNCRFLIDAISACDEEQIQIDLSTPTSGCFMRAIDNEKSNYVFMVLPVRLYN